MPIISRADNQESDFWVKFRGLEIFNKGDEFFELQKYQSRTTCISQFLLGIISCCQVSTVTKQRRGGGGVVGVAGGEWWERSKIA